MKSWKMNFILCRAKREYPMKYKPLAYTGTKTIPNNFCRQGVWGYVMNGSKERWWWEWKGEFVCCLWLSLNHFVISFSENVKSKTFSITNQITIELFPKKTKSREKSGQHNSIYAICVNGHCPLDSVHQPDNSWNWKPFEPFRFVGII